MNRKIIPSKDAQLDLSLQADNPKEEPVTTLYPLLTPMGGVSLKKKRKKIHTMENFDLFKQRVGPK